MNPPPMAAPPAPAANEPMEESDSCSVPTSALKGAKVGDTVSFTVKSIDGENAMLSYEDDAAESTEPKGSTISEAAKLFDEGGEE